MVSCSSNIVLSKEYMPQSFLLRDIFIPGLESLHYRLNLTDSDLIPGGGGVFLLNILQKVMVN